MRVATTEAPGFENQCACLHSTGTLEQHIVEMLRDAPLPAPAQADQPQPETDTEVPMSVAEADDRAGQSVDGAQAQPSHAMSSSPEQGLLPQEQPLVNPGNAPDVIQSSANNTGAHPDPNSEAPIQEQVPSASTAGNSNEEHGAMLESAGTEPGSHDLEVSETPAENGMIFIELYKEKADMTEIQFSNLGILCTSLNLV